MRRAHAQGLPPRERLASDREYFIRTDGNDSNTGFTNTPSGALRTPQRWWDIVTDDLDFRGRIVQAQLGPGRFPGIQSDKGTLGAGYLGVRIRGHSTNPQDTIVQANGVAPFQFFQTGGPVSLLVEDMQLESYGYGDHIFASSSLVYIAGKNLLFGACASVNIRAYNGAEVDLLSPCTFAASPGGGIALYANAGAVIAFQGLTMTMASVPHYSTMFAYANGGQLLLQHNAYAGAATGVRYLAVNLGLIDTGGGGPSALPGDKPGMVAAGGVYN